MSGNANASHAQRTFVCTDCQQGTDHTVLPDLGSDDFTCPSCGQHSWQAHLDLYGRDRSDFPDNLPHTARRLAAFAATRCSRCKAYAMWHGTEPRRPIYPYRNLLPPAALNMPGHVARDYEEARSIYGGSIRASIAILGLALRTLCQDVGVFEPDLLVALQKLVQLAFLSPTSLPPVLELQPGVVHSRDEASDDPHTAYMLCRLINEIVEKMSSRGGTPDK